MLGKVTVQLGKAAAFIPVHLGGATAHSSETLLEAKSFKGPPLPPQALCQLQTKGKQSKQTRCDGIARMEWRWVKIPYPQ